MDAFTAWTSWLLLSLACADSIRCFLLARWLTWAGQICLSTQTHNCRLDKKKKTSTFIYKLAKENNCIDIFERLLVWKLTRPYHSLYQNNTNINICFSHWFKRLSFKRMFLLMSNQHVHYNYSYIKQFYPSQNIFLYYYFIFN